MKTALLRYRVMANVVGVLLIVLILVGVPLKYLTEDGHQPPARPASGSRQNLGIAHGWLYMIFLVMAFLLSRKARWSIGFTLGHPALRHRPGAVLLGRAPGHRAGPRAARRRPRARRLPSGPDHRR